MYVPSVKIPPHPSALPTKLLCFLYHYDTLYFPLATLNTPEVPPYSSFCLIVRPYCLIVRRSDQITKVHRHTSSSSSHTSCPSSHIPSLLLFAFLFPVHHVILTMSTFICEHYRIFAIDGHHPSRCYHCPRSCSTYP